MLARSPFFIEDFLSPVSRQSAFVAYWFFVRTAQSLHRVGKTAEARWTLDFGRERFPTSYASTLWSWDVGSGACGTHR